MAENKALMSTLGLLTHLSIDELKEVLNDNEKFENVTKDANVTTKNVENSEKEMLIVSNKSLAEFNLTRAEEFHEKKCKLADMYQELREINAAVQNRTTKLKELTQKSNSDVVLALLQTAASECEQETDEIAEKFLSGNIKIEEFLDQFLSRRKTMHLRKAKVEKMLELVSRHPSIKGSSVSQQAASQNNKNFQLPNYSNAPVNVPYPTNNVPYPINNVPYPTNNVPYPLGAVNMPMPNNYMPNHF